MGLKANDIYSSAINNATRKGTTMERKYWNVDLTSDEYVMDASLSRVPAETGEQAGEVARKMMAAPEYWRVVGIDRA